MNKWQKLGAVAGHVYCAILLGAFVCYLLWFFGTIGLVLIHHQPIRHNIATRHQNGDNQ